MNDGTLANDAHQLKTKTSDEERGSPKTQGARSNDIRWKWRQPQNARGSKQGPPMKKEATPKYKDLKAKTSNEKGGNTKLQGAQRKDLWWKKRQPQNARSSKQRSLMKKEVTPKRKGLQVKSSEEKGGNHKKNGTHENFSQITRRRVHQPKSENRYFTEVSFANLML
jgi:hypothetical protein